jgi:tetratricopeptide (TPR) repeat protein
MSEDNANLKGPAEFDAGRTQPLKPVKKAPRWRSILLSVLGVLVLLAMGALGGYSSGIGARKAAQSSAISAQLMEQFQYTLVDEKFGRYPAAKQRLEFIIQNDPGFPGAQAELAKVLVQLSIPTATRTPRPTPTADLRGVQSLFDSAQQLVAAGDWVNALTTLDQLRKQAPGFNTPQVDGMYYFSLRNYGVNLIQQQGDLEGGSYQLDLAEHFAPLDNTASALREGARAYIQASSYFGVDWNRSVELFRNVANGWPAMWDGSMNATRRFQLALMRYGDQLWAQGQACEASQLYQEAQGIGELDFTAAKNANQAYQQCYPATEEPTATPGAPLTITPGPRPTKAPTKQPIHPTP